MPSLVARRRHGQNCSDATRNPEIEVLVRKTLRLLREAMVELPKPVRITFVVIAVVIAKVRLC
jgi:hypothetical protein